MRVDAKKNLQKVATEVLKDPLATQQEIANRTGMSRSNVGAKLAQVGNIDRTSAVVAIADTDLEIVSLGQSKILGWMQDLPQDKVSREDAQTMNQVIRESQKRYSFLGGENSNDKGGELKVNIQLNDESTIKALDSLLGE